MQRDDDGSFEEMDESVAEQAERRAKAAKLRTDLSVQRGELTSAPPVTVVDEFYQKLSQGEQQRREASDGGKNALEQKKIFYAEKGKLDSKKKSDLSHNNLLDEAKSRSQGKGGGFEKGEEEFSLSSAVSIREVTYQDGQYVGHQEDQGYQSSLSSPNESQMKRTGPPASQKQLLTVQKATADPFSQSLPESLLGAVKNFGGDLSDSIRSNASTRSKVVFDPRIFKTSAPASSPDPEKEYFRQMNKFHSSSTASRQGSIDKGHLSVDLGDRSRDGSLMGGASAVGSVVGGLSVASSTERGQQRGNGHGRGGGASHVRKWEEPTTPLECIDLGDPIHRELEESMARSRRTPGSPALSSRTEFGDPDQRGVAQGGSGPPLLSLHTIARVFGRPRGKASTSSRGWSPTSEGAPSPEGDESSSDSSSCHHCQHRRRISCWTVLSLLAVDLFTILLIFVIATQSNQMPMDVLAGDFAPAQRSTGGQPSNSAGRGRSLDFPSDTNSSTSFLVPVPGGSPDSKVNTDPGGETNKIISQDLEQLKEDMKKELDIMRDQLKIISHPPAFSCHKTEEHVREAKLSYEGCSVENPGMDVNTGIFTVAQPGIYQITFTGFFRSKNGHMLSADIYLRSKGNEASPIIIGRASAKVDENGFAGKDDDLHTTTSVIVLEQLKLEDEVFVSMAIHGDHGDSSLWSDFSRKIHFTAFRISD